MKSLNRNDSRKVARNQLASILAMISYKEDVCMKIVDLVQKMDKNDFRRVA